MQASSSNIGDVTLFWGCGGEARWGPHLVAIGRTSPDQSARTAALTSNALCRGAFANAGRRPQAEVSGCSGRRRLLQVVELRQQTPCGCVCDKVRLSPLWQSGRGAPACHNFCWRRVRCQRSKSDSLSWIPCCCSWRGKRACECSRRPRCRECCARNCARQLR